MSHFIFTRFFNSMATHSDVPIFGNKLGGVKEVYTEPFDSVVEVNNRSLETQVCAALHDTEVLHDVDSAEHVEAYLVDGYDTEVVPDSDDEVTDAVERNGLSCQSSGFVDTVPPSFSPCKQQRHPVVDIAACADSGHIPGQSMHMIDCKGNDASPVTVQSKIQSAEVYFKDTGLSQVQDADSVSSISCAVITDNCKYLSEGVKFDCDVKTSQWKVREVHIVYTRKRKRASCTLRDKVEQEETRALNTNCECAGLSYVNSQEPEDLSKALLFVDEYVSVNAVDSSPVGNVNVKDRSPSVSNANGIQSVVRWAKLRDKVEETRFFEWDPSQETEGKFDSFSNSGNLFFPGSKYGKIYTRKSPELKNVISKKQGNPDIFCNEKTENFNNTQSLRDLTHLNAKLAVCDSETAGDVEETNEREVREHVDAKLDLQGHQEYPIIHLETSAVHKDLQDNFDVGIDTQIAAEAIQELSFAAPAGFSDMNADQCLNERKNDAGVWPFPKKARSGSISIVSQPMGNRKFLCSENKRKRGPILKLEERKNVEKLTRKCLDGRSFEDSGMPKFTKKAKIKRGKGANSYNFKENLSSCAGDEDLLLCELKHGRKQRNVLPLAGSLKLPNLLNMNEDLINKSLESKSDHKEVGLHYKRKERSTKDRTLGVSAEMENHSVLQWEKSRISGNVNASKEDETHQIICQPAIYTPGGEKNHQWEFNLHDKDKEGCIGANMPEDSSLMDNFSKSPSSKFTDAENIKITHESKSCTLAPKSWFLSDYSKGIRVCSRMLCHSDGSSGLDYSYAKFRMECGNHSSLKSQFSLESLPNPSSFGSTVKRKQRSSVYINPCWYSFKENHNESFQSLIVDVSRQKQIYDGAPVVQNKSNTSEQLINGDSTVQLDEASDKDFACTMNGAKTVDDQGVVSYKNLKSHDFYHMLVSPKNPPLTDETSLVNTIDGCCEQAGKKKAILSPLTRELVRLGFSESTSEFTSKDSRRRKTMANIRILLSQNLDKGTLKQQKKILARLGVPMVSSPYVATHFIADKFARTRNMLESIAQGKPVVTHQWLESCDQAGSYIDERNYILRDVKKEQEIGFNLPLSLNQARQHPLLKGYRVFITPNTKPGQELLTSLIKAAHGQVLHYVTSLRYLDVDEVITLPQAVDLIMDCKRIPWHDWLILSCEEDKDYCVPFLKKGATAYSPELILNGIIVQKLEFERHRLFTKYVKRH